MLSVVSVVSVVSISQASCENDSVPMTHEELILALLGEVTPMLRNYSRSTGLEFDDLYQEASVTILKILFFQSHSSSCPNQQVPFLHGADLVRYITASVKKTVLMLMRRAKIRQTLSLDIPLSDDPNSCTLADILPSPYDVNPEDILLAKERLANLAPIIAQPRHYKQAQCLQGWKATWEAQYE